MLWSMIIVKAPLRISFVGGGTDLPIFYKKYPGQVLSATIDKYVYIAINPAPLLKGITARYSITEVVQSPKDLKNDRIREIMLDLKIKDSMEIGVFSQLPIGTGLGGSSSFTVALIKGLSSYLGKRLDKTEIAKIACKIEIDLLREPIGKQDQYAASIGGFNVFHFSKDETVKIEPLFLDYKKRIDLENHLLVFFTGITRKASTILEEQKMNTLSKIDTLKSMADLVEVFKLKLLQGDFEALGKLLHENWLKKKTLASKISNITIDQIYQKGIDAGAWGGKILGAGGGGCILFLSPISKKREIKNQLIKEAKKSGLEDFKEIPIKFVQSGVEIISSTN